MLELFSKYTISEITIFCIVLIFGLKELISVADWFKERLKKQFDKEEVVIDYAKELSDMQCCQKDVKDSLIQIQNKIEKLTDSDRDSIKTFITEKHHFFCYTKHWIDDYSLEGIEKRYQHYLDMGGNSYVGGLMQDLRELSKEPPK